LAPSVSLFSYKIIKYFNLIYKLSRSFHCQRILLLQAFMDIVILQSAYKHGITSKSIYSCLLNCRSDIMLENPLFSISPMRRLIVGFDHRGIALEIIALDDIKHDHLVVIHAMKLRKKYYHLLQEDANEL